MRNPYSPGCLNHPGWLVHPRTIVTNGGGGTLLGSRALSDLLDAASLRDQARLLEQRTGVGSSWMTALPVSGTGNVVSSDQYAMGLRWWLGAPLLQTDTS